MMARATALVLFCCILTVGVCSAEEPLTRENIDAFYHFAWREMIHNADGHIAKPKLDPIHAVDLAAFEGTYVFDYAPDNLEVVSFKVRGNKWGTKQKSYNLSGSWRLVGDKIVLLRGGSKDSLRAFVLRIKGQWYFNDADLPRGIALLKPRA